MTVFDMKLAWILKLSTCELMHLGILMHIHYWSLKFLPLSMTMSLAWEILCHNSNTSVYYGQGQGHIWQSDVNNSMSFIQSKIVFLLFSCTSKALT